MSTIDEILASGQYVDRRGREWVRRLFLRPNIRWANIIRDSDGIGWPGEKISEDRMRLLIERDQHECPGLRLCCSHPVPNVLALQDDISGAKWGHGFGVYRPRLGVDREAWVDTISEAMDAARALAVGE